ncbi:MAG: alpha-1,4-glucan--maltose-1-phosphate maltosyltransferase [Acidobacteria bacterium]|nr:alpha-1,4-glucan--maltose-1-phosphate maltosyltransferase [Acidobacteriota bacterium]
MAKTSTKKSSAHKAGAAGPSERTAGGLDPQFLRRVVVENIYPEIDCGRFPIKRTTGETVLVSADVHTDGHDVIGASLLYRRQGEPQWSEVAMEPAGNDRYTGAFTVHALGRYEYTVEGWIDRFTTWRLEMSKKFGAGQDVTSELLEGAQLVHRALQAGGTGADDRDVSRHAPLSPRVEQLAQWAATLGDPALSPERRVVIALESDLQHAMAARADRRRRTRYDRVLEVIVEPERARFGAWYEMFPRSAGTDATRSATFTEAAARLSYVAGMGFDVLYLPPIHPIGRSFRKGPNNTLDAGPHDPGSPWAIGGEAGGHKAVEPGLGTLEDFDRFVDAARHHGLEIALDLAYQASPDHPYVSEHPEWFRRRPDGTIKYAENPPKKYQDIYPINFESEAWQALWHELKSVIEFWIGHGVRIFRVDNPHTKPYRFWQWALAEITREHPDAIFLAEAFTRPKVMKYLAKSGFSQSYTYFTWRNTSAELTAYFTELTQTEVREYMRPNLFANTPDILHEYLQRGGRAAFQVRLILAATLGASYGIYSGYELGENVPVKAGSEEYLDSEKYQIRLRDFDDPTSLAELVARVNTIRREHPALQRDWGLRFHPTDNSNLLSYSKRSEDGADVLLMVVNLDPATMQHGFVKLPLSDWGIGPERTIEVRDLLSEERYFWRGEWNYVRLDPQARAAHILSVQLPAVLGAEPAEPVPA